MTRPPLAFRANQSRVQPGRPDAEFSPEAEAQRRAAESPAAHAKATASGTSASGRGGIRRRLAAAANREHLGVPAIRRLARRAGVRRISPLLYPDVRQALREHLRSIIGDAALFAEHAGRYTLTSMDVIRAAKRRGQTIYGLGDYLPEQMEKVRKQVAKIRAPLPPAAYAKAPAQASHERQPQKSARAVGATSEAEAEAADGPVAVAVAVSPERATTLQRLMSEAVVHLARSGSNMCSTLWLLDYVNRALSKENPSTPCPEGEFGALLVAMEADDRLTLVDGHVWF